MLPELVGTVGHCSDKEGPFFFFLNPFDLDVKSSKESPALLISDNHFTLQPILYCRKKNIIRVGHTLHPLQPLDMSYLGPLKTYYSQACDNFRVTHPEQTISQTIILVSFQAPLTLKQLQLEMPLKGLKNVGSSLIILLCLENMNWLQENY
ncbi:DDE-1 domain-containing protein [Trichonephila clavipes]|nr:DDE-1 domain-containing protein [Trichonephila clavipes]